MQCPSAAKAWETCLPCHTSSRPPLTLEPYRFTRSSGHQAHDHWRRSCSSPGGLCFGPHSGPPTTPSSAPLLLRCGAAAHPGGGNRGLSPWCKDIPGQGLKPDLAMTWRYCSCGEVPKKNSCSWLLAGWVGLAEGTGSAGCYCRPPDAVTCPCSGAVVWVGPGCKWRSTCSISLTFRGEEQHWTGRYAAHG